MNLTRKCIVRPPSPWEYKDPSRAAFQKFKGSLEWKNFCERQPDARFLHDHLEQRAWLTNPRRFRYGLLAERGHVQGIAEEVLRVVECNLDAVMVAQRRFGGSTRFAPIFAPERKHLDRIEADLEKAGVGRDLLRAVAAVFERSLGTIAEDLIRHHTPWSDHRAAVRRMNELVEKLGDRLAKGGMA